MTENSSYKAVYREQTADPNRQQIRWSKKLRDCDDPHKTFEKNRTIKKNSLTSK